MADTQNILEKVVASSPASRTHSAGAQLQAALADHRVGAPSTRQHVTGRAWCGLPSSWGKEAMPLEGHKPRL